MKGLSVSVLALALAATTGVASAQSYRAQDLYAQTYLQPSPDRYGRSDNAQYDYARVLRVDPVVDSYGRNPHAYGSSGYGDSVYRTAGRRDRVRCYERQTYVNGGDRYYDDRYDDRYYDGRYDDRYRDDYYRSDRYDDRYGNYDRGYGNDNGSTIATVIGGVLGAVVGSQVGGGSARYATSAIGTMIGGIAGREVYQYNQRDDYNRGTVRVCEPVRTGNGYYPSQAHAVTAYDVTYEYAGRSYTTRTNYHPGDRIRVRVDVVPVN